MPVCGTCRHLVAEQGVHVGGIVAAPQLHGAVKGAAVQVVGALAEGQARDGVSVPRQALQHSAVFKVQLWTRMQLLNPCNVAGAHGMKWRSVHDVVLALPSAVKVIKGDALVASCAHVSAWKANAGVAGHLGKQLAVRMLHHQAPLFWHRRESSVYLDELPAAGIIEVHQPLAPSHCQERTIV